MSRTPHQALYFAPFRITADVDLLYRGETVVPLEPQAVRVLRYLAENHDRVVSKEELLESVWPDVYTTDGVLKKAISQARRALGDEADQARFIQTFHGRGYRFIAPVAAGSPPAEAGRPPERPAVTSVADPDYDQLVGREPELSALCAEYRRTLEGRGRPILILGEPGIGKTQLARHFWNWAGEQGALWLYGRFFDYRGSRRFSHEVFLNFLRIALGLARMDARGRFESGQLSDLRQAAEARCGVTLPEELVVESGGATGALAARGGAAAGDHFRLITPLGKCFVRLCRQRPIVMVLDDVQWADEASRDLIGHLMRATQGEPLMIVTLIRQSGTRHLHHPLQEWLRRQADYRSYSSLSLKPLDEQGCGAAIEAIFGGRLRCPEVPPPDLHRLYRVTGGNPYFLTEMLRLLVAEGAIQFGGAPVPRWTWRGIEDLRLPETIVMAAQTKLDRLSPPVREIVEEAAVLGDEFRVATLARMAGRAEVEIESLLEEALHRGVLADRGLGAGEDYRFYHTILRRVLYDGLPARQRKDLHARAAGAMEQVYAGEADQVAAAIGAHQEAAGDVPQTLAWSLRAWQAASNRLNWGEAVTAIERARRAAEELGRRQPPGLPPAARLDIMLGLGETYYSVGRFKESDAALASAAGFARTLDDQRSVALALLRQGRTRLALGLYREGNRLTGKALAIYRRLGDAEGVALALIQLSEGQISLGHYATTAPLVEALESVGEGSPLATEARGLLGWARVLQGHFAEGTALLEGALEDREGTGEVRPRALLLCRLSWAHVGQGRYETAVDLARRAGEDFRSIGDVIGEAKASLEVGLARICQGLDGEGLESVSRAQEALKGRGDVHCEAEALWLVGRADVAAGRHAQAAEPLRRALELVRAIGDRDDEFRILTEVARGETLQGDGESGLRSAEQAIAIAEDLQNRDGLGAALAERARALVRLQRPEEARAAAERAVELLEVSGSGESWRGHWALALALEAGPRRGRPADRERAVAALRRSVELQTAARDQLAPGDLARRTQFTRAQAGPARDLRRALSRQGLAAEAAAVAEAWSLDDESE